MTSLNVSIDVQNQVMELNNVVAWIEGHWDFIVTYVVWDKQK